MNTHQPLTKAFIFQGLAWLLLLVGFAGTYCNTLALKTMTSPDPAYAYDSYMMFYITPLALMIWAFLAFEGWSARRTGELNPWVTILLIYICIASLFTIYSGLTVNVSRENILMFRENLTGSLALLRAFAIAVVFGFYALTLIRHAKMMPAAITCGRVALWLWLLYFTVTRLLQPIRALDFIIKTEFS
jgi:hypothetical protein